MNVDPAISGAKKLAVTVMSNGKPKQVKLKGAKQPLGKRYVPPKGKR